MLLNLSLQIAIGISCRCFEMPVAIFKSNKIKFILQISSYMHIHVYIIDNIHVYIFIVIYILKTVHMYIYSYLGLV